MRKQKTRTSLRSDPVGKLLRGPGRGRKPGHKPTGLDHTQIVALVCRYFCDGHPAAEIKDLLKRNHGITVSREEPYRYLAYAAGRRWIRFVAPQEHAMREWLSRTYGWLRRVDIVHTAISEDVAYHGAEMLLYLLQLHCQPPYSQRVVHVGFAGGQSMRRVAQVFAELLREPRPDLPATVFFHALVAGFDVEDPTTDPNAFFTYFVDDPAIRVETRFVGLHAPAFVRTERLAEDRALPGIDEAFARAKDIDIVVTSASSWSESCQHSMLRKYMAKSPRALRELEQAGCQADMLWRPLGQNGPLDTETEIRAMTLLELQDLPRFIKDGNHVLLVLGPCGHCHAPKTDVLDIVLRARNHLITHLVADSRSAAGLAERSAASSAF